MATLQKITPNFWFDSEAEEAAKFYTSVFPDSHIRNTSYYGKEGQEIHHRPEGSVMTVEFTLAGQEFVALNGGPLFKFNESVSFIINCRNQQEVDYFWEKLTAGGDPNAQQCGWLKDKFGLSWQVVPSRLNELMKDPAVAGKVVNAFMKMKKLDIAALEAAAKK